MNKALQVLVAVAAIVVIAAGGVYLRDAKRQADEQAKREAVAEWVRKAETAAWVEAQKASKQAEVDACAADLAAYEQGNVSAFVARASALGEPMTGYSMMAEVEKCRDMTGS